ATTQLKLTAADGKKYLSDALAADGIIALAAEFPSKIGAKFISWFTRSDDTVDGKSKQQAYSLFDSSFIDGIEVGTVKGLQQIHAYLFGGLYDFAGQIRTKNISKGGFTFAHIAYLEQTLHNVEEMPESTVDEIVNKYVEMNVAHPFMEGNGRSMRIWLDLMLKKNCAKCVDWSKIDKMEYLDAMRQSPADDLAIHKLIDGALTDKIFDREIFMKGVDYSYYYEEN
ncbi:MAG: Fic family protein, partial [Clostridia bacterium]|nr:Fic family protein [Clostridia bacterium]